MSESKDNIQFGIEIPECSYLPIHEGIQQHQLRHLVPFQKP